MMVAASNDIIIKTFGGFTATDEPKGFFMPNN
jgi:hypothetical protein